MDIQLPTPALTSLPLGTVSKGIQTNAYTDLTSLNAIKTEENQDEALKKVAKQFESLFVHELMKNMRSANKAFEENNLFDNKESNFFRDMYDQQMSLSLSERGMGLSEVLYRQMKANYAVDASASSSSDKIESGLRVTDKKVPINESKAVAQAPVSTKLDSQTSLDRVFENTNEFIDSILPMAKKAASALGLDPLVMVAQSALETGWGKHIVKDAQGSSNNLFNIKADSSWKGDKVSVSTLEYRDGIAVKEKAFFRKYDSIEESMKDFMNFISTNPRYQQAVDVAHDGKQFIENLQKSGYATDPDYANKIMSVLQGVSKRIADSASRVGG